MEERGERLRKLTKLGESLSAIAEPQINIADGAPDRGNAYWYKFEVVQSANKSGKFANFTEDHYFVKATVRADRERLVFVISMHHVGRELSGIMEATAFARLESFEDSDDREYAFQDFFLCTVEPFVFTYKTSEAEIVAPFARWLDAAVAVASKNTAIGSRVSAFVASCRSCRRTRMRTAASLAAAAIGGPGTVKHAAALFSWLHLGDRRDAP